MIKVAAYTGGRSTPSARMRVRQYKPLLRLYGVDIHEYTLSSGKSMPSSIPKRPAWMAKTLWQRAISVPASYLADLTLISRSVLPGFLPVDRVTRSPRVLDVDDAIWLNRGGHRAGELAAHCDSVICGNSFLAEYFARWNRNITILPTAVDTDKIHPAEPEQRDDSLVIGWTGTSQNFRYLYDIEKSLATVLTKHPRAQLRIIADTRPQFRDLDPCRVHFVKWSPEQEITELQKFTVGLMPLRDSPWERGKCSFKMLMYMASGTPVVVSPVGMNAQVLSHGDLGFGPTTQGQWSEALDAVLSSLALALRMGAIGRKVALESYSVQKLAPILAGLLHSAAKGKGIKQ
jgi:glycosyltransferase involved in cell wall biosynthesis